ncbi:YqzE family protein [Gracilibacillus marinus]|uniref:YqzE family protein n=1 Tax=Gracilibacillus marinus TaxID=630535 RepID=A0ABV8VVK5_9BACI
MAKDEYVKYVTQRVVKYMETPKAERKKIKTEKKETRSQSSHWFGVLPFAFRLFLQRRKG